MGKSKRIDTSPVFGWDSRYAEAADARLVQLTHEPLPTFAERVEMAALSALIRNAHQQHVNKAFTEDDLWLLVRRLRGRDFDPNDTLQRDADQADWDTVRTNLGRLMEGKEVQPGPETAIDRTEQNLQETLANASWVINEHRDDPECLANVMTWLPRPIVGAIRHEASKEWFGSPAALGAALFTQSGSDEHRVRLLKEFTDALLNANDRYKPYRDNPDFAGAASSALGYVAMWFQLVASFVQQMANAANAGTVAQFIDLDAFEVAAEALTESEVLLTDAIVPPTPVWGVSSSGSARVQPILLDEALTTLRAMLTA